LPFSRVPGVGEALTVARGTAAMGAEGTGEGAAWMVFGAEGAEAPDQWPLLDEEPIPQPALPVCLRSAPCLHQNKKR